MTAVTGLVGGDTKQPGRLMSSAESARRSVKIRRRGRHAAPSQVEKVAGKAVVAAPAVAIAGGVIMGGTGAANAAPTTAAVSVQAGTGAHAAVNASTARPAAHATLDAATTADRSYAVKSGDTLGSIARQFYGAANDWHWIADQNSSIISDPNLIFPGQNLRIPSSAPASPAVSTQSAVSSANDSDDASASTASTSPSTGSTESTASVSSYSGSESGTLGCSGLEHLWEQAGGNPGEAVTAASIAMAESGGNQYAVSPTSDYGYWQINSSHGSMATFDPIGNAKAAISISGNGSDWSPWSTYTSGAYQGRC